MAKKGNRVITDLKAEVSRDLNRFVDDFVYNLKATTPIRTGNARNGWVKTFDKRKVGKQSKYGIAKNDVEYIERLDQGWSSQATNIVENAFKKTRKK